MSKCQGLQIIIETEKRSTVSRASLFCFNIYIASSVLLKYLLFNSFYQFVNEPSNRRKLIDGRD